VTTLVVDVFGDVIKWHHWNDVTTDFSSSISS